MMNMIPSFLVPKPSRIIQFCAPVLFIIAAGILCEAPAQSGRRSSGQPSIPTPPLSSTETTATGAATKRPSHASGRIKLLFARQPTSKHLLNEDVIATSFFKRLSQYEDVDCVSIGDLKQSQAIARARSEQAALVVVLRFDINSFQSGTLILNSPDLEIEYFALTPGSAKKRAKGKLYFQTIGGGRMQKSEWPNGTPIKITPEGAGIEAAETLYQLLAIKPSVKPRT